MDKAIHYLYMVLIGVNALITGTYIARGNGLWIIYAITTVVWMFCLTMRIKTMILRAQTEVRREVLSRGYGARY